MNTETHHINLQEGTIFLKKWIPDSSNIDEKKILFLLHDSLGSVDLWRDFPALLATQLQCTVIAYDRLGFGKSDDRQEPPSFNFIEKEAIQYFPQIKAILGITDYVAMGHSVGGSMAIHIASQDKDCKAVITLSAQAFVEDITIQGIETAKKLFTQPGQIDRLQKWHGNKAKWVLDAWINTWLADEFENWSLNPIISDVTAPTLVIHGDNDEYGSVAFPKYIANKVSGNSTMFILDDCGHVPHRQKPKETIQAIKLFLENI